MATNPNPSAHLPETGVDARLERLEAQIAEMHKNLQTAIAGQEQLQEQLRAALDELSEALLHRNGASRPARQEHPDPQIQKIEARLRGVEQRVEKTSSQVAGVLESRIWRTLVRGSSVLTRFLR